MPRIIQRNPIETGTLKRFSQALFIIQHPFPNNPIAASGNTANNLQNKSTRTLPVSSSESTVSARDNFRHYLCFSPSHQLPHNAPRITAEEAVIVRGPIDVLEPSKRTPKRQSRMREIRRAPRFPSLGRENSAKALSKEGRASSQRQSCCDNAGKSQSGGWHRRCGAKRSFLWQGRQRARIDVSRLSGFSRGEFNVTALRKSGAHRGPEESAREAPHPHRVNGCSLEEHRAPPIETFRSAFPYCPANRLGRTSTVRLTANPGGSRQSRTSGCTCAPVTPLQLEQSRPKSRSFSAMGFPFFYASRERVSRIIGALVRS